MWFKKLLYRWAMAGGNALSAGKPVAVDWAQTKNPNQLSGEQTFTVSVRRAINGSVLELGTYKPQSRGPDWSYEYFVVPDGESLSDAVTALLVNQRLKQ